MSIRLILISTAIILAIILSVMYPHQIQSPQVIQQYNATTGIVVVFVSGNSWDTVMKVFMAKYPNYEVIDHYYSEKRQGYFIKGRLK